MGTPHLGRLTLTQGHGRDNEHYYVDLHAERDGVEVLLQKIGCEGGTIHSVYLHASNGYARCTCDGWRIAEAAAAKHRRLMRPGEPREPVCKHKDAAVVLAARGVFTTEALMGAAA